MIADLPEVHALPQSQEAERAVLAAILQDEQLLAVVSAAFGAEDFFLPRHQMVFEAMQELRNAGKPIDLRTLQAQLESRAQLEAAGGLAYLATLDSDLPDLSRVGSYAEIVRDAATRRKVIDAAGELIRSALDGGAGLDELQEQLQAAGTAMASRTGTTSQLLGEALEDAIDAVSAPERRHQGRGLYTGFRELDRLTGGLRPGWQVIIAGRPGMGKTTLGLNLAQRFALEEGEPGMIFSLEMSAEEVSVKLLSAHAEVPQRWITGGSMAADQWQRVIAASERFAAADTLLDCAPNLSGAKLEASCRARAAHGLRWIVVDYVGLMELDPRFYRQELAQLSRRLKVLARELGITTILLCQLNRATEGRSDPRPMLADLKDSGALEQDADLVLFPFRPEVYSPEDHDLKGKAELILAKNRHGPIGSAMTNFEGHLSRFVPRVEEEQPCPF